MNYFILKEEDKTETKNLLFWMKEDKRALHLLQVLKAQKGKRFRAAYENQEAHEIEYSHQSEDGLYLQYHVLKNPKTLPFPAPISLYIGLVRPPTTERLIRDLSSIGIESLCFFGTSLCEKSYLQSKIWQEKNIEWRLQEGMQQGGSSVKMKIKKWDSFDSLPTYFKSHLEIRPNDEYYLLDETKNEKTCNLVELCQHVQKSSVNNIHYHFIIGPERGFTEKEKVSCLEFASPLNLGKRILRAETAATSLAVAVSSCFC